MKNSLKLIFSFIVIFFGCEKEVDLKIDDSESKLVLNAWLKTDQHPVVEVNRSTFIFDKRGTDKIQNAEVVLFENDKEIGFLEHFGAGFYENESITIKPDTEYKIITKVDGFDDITAIEKSLKKFTFEDYVFEYETVPSQYGFDNQMESEITLTIKDDASTEDFYLFLVKSTYKNWNEENPEDTTYQEGYDYLRSSDLQIENVYFSTFSNMPLLTDQLINGNEYTLRFTANDLRKGFHNDGLNGSLYQNIFEIHKISKSFYLYLKSAEFNQYPDPFTEPTQIYTNVENGYGILATSAVVQIPIEETRDE